MWRGDQSPYRGRHYQLARPLNSPQSLTRPHPPIMIGGGGESKTLRLVARYADACNLFPGPDPGRKLDVLRAHCDAEGRDYDEITKTCYFIFDVGEKGEKTAEVIDQLAAWPSSASRPRSARWPMSGRSPRSRSSPPTSSPP